MRLAWIVSSADPSSASFRYRCLMPAWGLRHFGWRSTIFCGALPDPEAFDALIVVKLADTRLREAAESFRVRGKPVFFDLCDNVFVPGYAQRQDPALSGDSAIELARRATAVVTPAAALARVVRQHVGAESAQSVIPDAALTLDAYQAMSAWLPGRLARRRPSCADAGWRRLLDGVRRLSPRPRSAPPAGESRRPAGEQFDADSDWQAEHLPRDTARIVWFGRHGSFHSEFGMNLLRPLMPELDRLHRTRPVELVVISNNPDRFETLVAGAKFFTRYQSWSSERVFFEMSRADLFVMPNGSDSFAQCKSANRAVLALANNVPVVASYLESLEPLRESLVIDDWRGGFDRYLLQDGAARPHLRRAREIIAGQYSIDAVARQWHALVADGVTRRHSLPEPSVPPASPRSPDRSARRCSPHSGR